MTRYFVSRVPYNNGWVIRDNETRTAWRASCVGTIYDDRAKADKWAARANRDWLRFIEKRAEIALQPEHNPTEREGE